MEFTDIRESDFMLTATKSIIPDLIRFRCGTVVSHLQPFHRNNGEWVLLDATIPRLKLYPLSSVIEDAVNKETDFFVFRQTYASEDVFTKTVYPFNDDLAKKRPYYDIWALICFLFTLPRLKKSYKNIKRRMEELGIKTPFDIDFSSDDKLRSYMETFMERYDRVSGRLLYCTEILRETWLYYGTDVINIVCHKDYCTPIEAEEFCRKNGQFLFGYYNGQPSDELYQQVMKQETNKALVWRDKVNSCRINKI